MSHTQLTSRQHVFDFGRERLVALLTNPALTVDTYAEHSDAIQSYLAYLSATSGLPSLSATSCLPSELSVPEETPETEPPCEDTRLIGIFQKNLTGGVVTNDDQLKRTPAFISESWVRKHGLSHGDRVKILGYRNNRASDIQIVEKQEPEITPNIKMFVFGLVENSAGSDATRTSSRYRPYVIKQSIHGDKLAIPYRLTTNEIDRLNIHTGDVLDLAWYNNNPKTRKVIWKHQTEYDASATIAQKVLTHSRDKEPITPHTSVFTDNQFEGLTICLVGMDMYKDKFKKAVEERTGSFIHVDPKASRVRREAEYTKADIILLGLQQISHEASNHAVKFAKQEGIMYGSFNGHGTGPFILEVISKLQLTERFKTHKYITT